MVNMWTLLVDGAFAHSEILVELEKFRKEINTLAHDS